MRTKKQPQKSKQNPHGISKKTTQENTTQENKSMHDAINHGDELNSANISQKDFNRFDLSGDKRMNPEIFKHIGNPDFAEALTMIIENPKNILILKIKSDPTQSSEENSYTAEISENTSLDSIKQQEENQTHGDDEYDPPTILIPITGMPVALAQSIQRNAV